MFALVLATVRWVRSRSIRVLSGVAIGAASRSDLCDAGHAKAGFASVIVSAEPRDAAVPPPAMLVEIGGSVVRIAADAPAKLVTAVLRSLAR